MIHGSLFSGIGGFDLAAEWMGWENSFHCEMNPFGRKLLNHYWPKSISYEDITKTDFTIHRGRIDILTGGFPCQPYSTAGKRLGKEDDRHLWPEMLRAIREIKPKYVVGENVPGLISWNGGLVFDEVQADLEAEGYEVQSVILPAVSVNAPHRRDRIWFIAHSESHIIGNEFRNEGQDTQTVQEKRPNEPINVTNPNSERQQRSGRAQEQVYTEKKRDWKKYRVVDDGRWPTQSPICSGDDGVSDRLDGITFSEWSKESIKGAGNAIVPQVAYQIFKAINEITPNC